MKRAFTLVEIMIIVAVIALLAAIAIPNLLRARLNANESAALAALKTIASGAVGFRANNPTYPEVLTSLSEVEPPYIDSVLSTGSKQGYNFALTGETNSFTATARPQTHQVTGARSFFVDGSGVIRFTTADAEPGIDDSTLE